MSNNLSPNNSLDIQTLSKIFDKENMYLSIQSFPDQIKISNDITSKYNFNNKNKISDVIICGMGGSAIGGDFCRTLLGSDINIKIHVNRGYDLPNWISKNSLIIISSYSGNTEETISCYKQCLEKSFDPIVITTGGYLLDAAKLNKNNYIEVPKGYQPRLALGFSFTLIFLTLNKFNLINDNNIFIKKMESLITNLKNFNKKMFEENNPAFKLASKIYNKFIIIYSTRKLDSISYRFRCQLAENSKILSSHFIFPEHNHNEIEAFQNTNINNIAFLWMTDEDDLKENINRMSITKDILANSGSHFEIKINNFSNRYDRILKMVNYIDWISYYCALFNKTNPTPINKIQKLKSLL